MNRTLASVASALLLAGTLAGARPAAAEDRFRLELEGGAAWQLRNDFAVPGDTGTRIALDDATTGPFAAFRGTLWADVSKRTSLRVLAAPLKTTASLTPDTPVDFNGTTFPAGRPLDVTYVFNSYRLSWVYRFKSSCPVSFRAGLTGKVRDAKIELTGSGLQSTKSNVGVVPLLYGGVRWQMTDTLALDLDVDAAAAKQGRAEDVALRLEAKVSPKVDLFVGARTLEGGGDNDEVYSFAWFGYAVGGVAIKF
ncbi:MAG TPA: hypothetical protein VE129_04220 [Thermoanaerobaculia bacterium]|nr:hypothetical protein [Thermoanaerobaculia bacterium]